jgi:endonuclease YncB( thermonuclease family)
MKRMTASLLLATVLLPTPLLAADFSSPVFSVLDGDTIEVLHDQRAERTPLNGIDCPEKGQAFGKRAGQAVSELVLESE